MFNMKKRYAVTLLDIINKGMLQPGVKIFHLFRDKSKIAEGEVLPDGKIKINDRHIFNTPSEAAKFYSGNMENGWRWWKVKYKNSVVPLLKIRQQFIKNSFN